MQNISLHIEYLLRTHDCVILPGIGAFLRTHRGATVGQEDGSVSAPATQVCFNSSIVASDGLLCHSVARRNRVSFEEAAVMVSDAAESCRNALSRDGELAMGRLGLLKMDDEKRISFHPYRTLFDRIWTSVTPTLENVSLGKAAIERKETEVRVSDNKYYIIKVSRKAVRYAAMLTVCLLTAATLMLPSANRTGSELEAPRQYASVVPGVGKLAGHSDVDHKDNTTQIAVNAEESDAAEPQSVTARDDHYYLIVATFSKEADCLKFIDMQPDASDLKIIGSGKVSRVYSAASSDRDALVATMTSAEHKALHPQAWIWENPDAE